MNPLHLAKISPAALAVALLTAVACGPSSGTESASTTSGIVGGEELNVINDPNNSGEQERVRVVEIRWGRLVDVYDAEDTDGDPQTPAIRELQNRDFLIAQTVFGDGTNYQLETNPFTDTTELTILADADSDDPFPGSNETHRERFERLRLEATQNLGFVEPTGLGGSFSPPFPLVPRNATMSIRFSDLLDPNTIGPDTLRVFTGSPPTGPFEARIVADPNYGALLDVNGALQFRPTRILVDFTVSEIEAQGVSAPVNTVGLPPSSTNTLTNVVVRIPTELDSSVGQFRLLRNLAGKRVDFTGNMPAEQGPTMDVVRAFRSGRSDDNVTNQDPNNGFLLDVDSPRVIGSQGFTMSSPPVPIAPDSSQGDAATDRVYLVSFDYTVPECAQTPQTGNILSVPGVQFGEVFAQVTRTAAPPQNGSVSDVRVRVLRVPASAPVDLLASEFEIATQGSFESVYEPLPGVIPERFLEITPTPGAPPTSLIDVEPQITVRFSEPMDPDSVTPHDNFRLARVPMLPPPGPVLTDTVVAEITPSSDLREFRYAPVTPLDHTTSSTGNDSDTYYLNLVGGAGGVTDLAGNSVQDELPDDILLRVDNTLPTSLTGGFVFNFDEVDEDNNSILQTDLLPEVRGQFSYDLSAEVIRPRPVTRDSRPVDRTGLLYAVMTSTGAPIITPLSPRGSRMQTLWRYADVGYQILDESTANVDVEGISWSPFGGAVQTDFFTQFEMTLSHSRRLPDEYPIPISVGGGGYAQYQNSGLGSNFNFNDLKDGVNTQPVVHPRDRGYLLTPSEVFTASTGTPLMPFPMNRGIPPEDFRYYTWRDTAVTGLGGSAGFGADIKALVTVGALCDLPIPTVYTNSGLRSLAMPLLMEFKCFPDDFALGLNGLDTSFALATQRFPVFRIFSTGGVNKNGAVIKKNPDGQFKATGGFTPQGMSTPGNDNTVMIGQLDLVVRISRVHTIWLDTKTQNAGFPDYLPPILEPRPDQQPSGTSVQLAFRGASSVTGSDAGDSRQYDAYGDPLVVIEVGGPACPNPNVTSADTTMDVGTDTEAADIAVTYILDSNGDEDSSWKSTINNVDGAEFLQTRITFVSNAATGLTPELSTLAIAYLKD